MTCRETIEILSDYLEGLCGPNLLQQLEQHFADCAPCRAYLATFRKTRDLTHTVGQVEMPPEMKTRLRQFLLDQLRRASD